MKCFKNLLFVFTLFAVSLTSCSDEEIGTEDDALIDLLNRERAPEGFYQDGMLNFESLDQAKGYLDALELELAEASDADAYLQDKMAENPGMTLLEANSGAELDALDDLDLTEDEILALSDNDWVNSDLQMLMLNPDYELGIGNEIFVWYGHDQVYSFPKSNDELRAEFLIQPKNQGHPDLSILAHEPVSHSQDIFISNTKVTDLPSDQELTSKYDYYLVSKIEGMDCNSFGRTFSGNLYIGYTNNNGTPNDPTDDQYITEPWDGFFSISPGDGSNYSIGNSDFYNINHYYQSMGVYSLEVQATFTTVAGGIGTINTTKEINIEAECSKKYKKKAFFKESGNRALSGSLSFRSSVFGSRWNAKTYGWKKSIFIGKWKKKKANLTISGEADLRNEDCVIEKMSEASDECNNCSSIKIGKFFFFFKAYRDLLSDDIKSTHKGTFDNGLIINQNLLLDDCE